MLADMPWKVTSNHCTKLSQIHLYTFCIEQAVRKMYTWTIVHVDIHTESKKHGCRSQILDPYLKYFSVASTHKVAFACPATGNMHYAAVSS